jgi:hypothetical protein
MLRTRRLRNTFGIGICHMGIAGSSILSSRELTKNCKTLYKVLTTVRSLLMHNRANAWPEARNLQISYQKGPKLHNA